MLWTAINMVNTFIKWWKQEKMWWTQLFDLLYSYISWSEEDFCWKAEFEHLKSGTTFYEKRRILKFFLIIEGFLVLLELSVFKLFNKILILFQYNIISWDFYITKEIFNWLWGNEDELREVDIRI